MMAGFVAIATPAFGMTLFAVAARSPSAVRLTLAVSFVFGGAGTTAAIVFGPFVLVAFGKESAVEASIALIVLTLVTLPGVGLPFLLECRLGSSSLLLPRHGQETYVPQRTLPGSATDFEGNRFRFHNRDRTHSFLPGGRRDS